MKKTIKYLESLFAVEGDSYSPAEREAHNKAIQQAIDALMAVDATDTAFEMIRIHGYDEKLSPQAIGAINEAMPLIKIARFGKQRLDKEDLKQFTLSLLDEADLRVALKQMGWVEVVWCVDDIKGSAQDMDIKLTDKEVSDVVSSLERNHDASVGINWEVIRETIRMVVDERQTENA